MKDRQDYGREPWRDGLRQSLQANFGDPIKVWQPGDVALLRRVDLSEPSHVGILGDYPQGGLSLIHCHSRIAVTEHRIDEFWERLILDVYRPAWPDA